MMTEQQEWDALLAEIPAGTPTRDAATMLAAKLQDAVQAHRPWARQRLNEAAHAGLAKQWTAHAKKQRKATRTKNGTVKGVGGVRRGDGPNIGYVQVPLDEMTFSELAQYRGIHIANLSAARETAGVVNRLLELREKCPKATTPAEACELLDLNIEAVMAGAA